MPNRSLWHSLASIDRQLLDARQVGVLTDADGTLSEIQAHPDLAEVPASMGALLGRLSELYGLVAVVSGRRAKDVQALVGRPDLLYLGNHGLERRRGDTTVGTPAAREAAAIMAGVAAELGAGLPEAPGLYLENKESVLAVHYRQCSDEPAIEAAKALAARLSDTHNLRLQHGRRVTEIRPAGADKGKAVLEIAREYDIDQVIYLGDDATDIDAFKALREASGRREIDGVTIAVTTAESPPELSASADYYVGSVTEVERFFSWLVERAERLC